MNELLLFWITQFVDDGYNISSQVFAIQLQLLHIHLHLSALQNTHITRSYTQPAFSNQNKQDTF
jgi:hypothetical protein